MNTLVASVLNKVLGDWLEGVDQDRLDLSIYNGTVQLGPVKVRQDALDRFALPFVIRQGFITKIFVHIPWTSLSLTPMRLEIEGVSLYVAPRPKAQWSPATALENAQRDKTAQLSVFELISLAPSAAETADYTSGVMRKVINNLQVTVSGVYVRYEDQESANETFSIGLILNRLEAISCNREWIKAFTADSEINYKKVQVEGLSVFLDYGATCKAALQFGTDESDEQEFKRFAREETEQRFPFPHKFLLSPVKVTADFEINQNPRNKAVPQIALNLVLGDREYPLRCAFETSQATLLVKMTRYWEEYSNFQKGVLSETPNQPFTTEQGLSYRALYIRYKQFLDLNQRMEATALYPSLQALESSRSYDEIVRMRQAARIEAKLNEEERLSEAKLALLTTPTKEGKLSKMKMLIGLGESNAERNIKDEQRRREMEAVRVQIEGIRTRQARVMEEVKVFARVREGEEGGDETGYVRVVLMLRVPEYTFTLLNSTSALLDFWMNQFVLELSVRAVAGFALKLQLSKFLIRDEFKHSPLYPHIVESGRVQMTLDKTLPDVTKLTIPQCDQLVFVANLETLSAVAAQCSEAVAGQEDLLTTQVAKSRVDKYVELGKALLVPGVVLESPYHSFDVTVDLAAPCVFFPLALTSSNDILVLDLGKVKAASLLAKQAKSQPSALALSPTLYDWLHIELDNMEIATLSRLESIGKWRKAGLEQVFKPSKLEVHVKRRVERDEKQPALVVEGEWGLMAVTLSSSQLSLLSSLHSRLRPFLPSLPVLPCLPSPSHHFHCNIHQSSLTLLTTSPLFRVQLAGLQFVSAATEQGNRVVDWRVGSVVMEDLRNETQWRKVGGRAGAGRTEEKARRWLELEKITEDTLTQEEIKRLYTQSAPRDLNLDIHLHLSYIPSASTLTLSVALDHYRVIVNTTTLQALASLPLPAFSLSPWRKDLFSSFDTPAKSWKVTVSLARLDLWIPIDPLSQISKLLAFSTETAFLYTLNESPGTQREETGVVEVSRVGAKVGHVREGEVWGLGDKDELVKPVRLGGYYERLGTESRVEVSVEAVEVVLGVRDWLFFRALWGNFRSDLGPAPFSLPSLAPIPLPVAVAVSFKCELLSLLLYDDFTSHPSPYLKLCISSLSSSGCLQASASSLLIAGAAELLYYHHSISIWEPVVEYNPFEVEIHPAPGQDGSGQGKRRLEFQELGVMSGQMRAGGGKQEAVRVNLTYGMVERTMSLWRKAEGWREREEGLARTSSIILQWGIKVKNHTGVPFEVWLEGSRATEDQCHFQIDPSTSQTLPVPPATVVSPLLNAPYLPLRLGLQLDKVPIRGISIGAAGRYAYGRGEKDLSGLFVEVKTRPQKTVVSIESKVKLINNSSFLVTIERDGETRTVPAASMQTLPTTWLASASPLYLQTINGILVPLLTTTGPVHLDRDYTVMLDRCWVSKASGMRKQTHLQLNILLNPPLTIVNCFPARLLVTHISTGIETAIEPGQEARLFHVSGTREGSCFRWTVSMKTGESGTKPEMLEWGSAVAHYRMTGELPADKVTVETAQGYRGSRTMEWGEVTEEQFGGLLVQVYSQYWIINHTDHFLEFTGKKGGLHLPARSSGMVKCNKKTLQMRVKDSKDGAASDWSNEFNITSRGVAGLVVVQFPAKEGSLARVERHFGVLLDAGTWPVLKSTLLHIYPRYLLSSSLPFPIFLKQSQGSKTLEIYTSQSYSYQFENGLFDKHVQIGTDGENWSSSFSLDEIETFQLCFKSSIRSSGSEWWRPSSSNGFQLYVSASVSTANQAVVFIHFTPPEQPEIEVRNESSVAVGMRQEGCGADTVHTVLSGQTVPYAYTNHLPALKRVELTIPKHCQFYSFDKLKTFKTLLGRIEVSIEPSGNTRLVRLREHLDFGYKPPVTVLIPAASQSQSWNFALIVPHFELSLHDSSQKEVVLGSFSDVFLYYQYRQGVKEEVLYTKQTIGGNVGKAQVDDMKAGKGEWPVVFGCKEQEGVVPFAQVQVVVDSMERSGEAGERKVFTRVEYVAVQLQEMFLNLHQPFVLTSLHLSSQVHRLFRPPAPSPSSPDLQPVNPLRPAPHLSQKTFYQSLNLAAMKVTITLRAGSTDSSFLDLGTADQLGDLARYAAAIIDVTEASLGFSSIIVVNSFQTLGSMLEVIRQQYTSQGILQFYKLLGSSDLLGNPLGLIDKLGTGVFEFFSQPIKGLMKSPQDFAQGVGKGVKSLVSGVITGSVGSVSKVTGSLYTLMRKAGGDTETADLRSDNVVVGLYKGVTGSVVELTEGVAGVFVKPWKGAQTGGVSGFFRGVGTGVFGAAVAPLAAVLRLSTSVTSSVATQASTLGAIAKPLGRVRFPRQIRARREVETYNEALARAQVVLRLCPGELNGNLIYFTEVSDTAAVLLTEKNLIYVDAGEIEGSLALHKLDRTELRSANRYFYLFLVSDHSPMRIIGSSFQLLARLYCALETIQGRTVNSSLV